MKVKRDRTVADLEDQFESFCPAQLLDAPGRATEN